MKLTIELTHDELCDIVREHVQKQVGEKVSGDVSVKIGGRYSYCHEGAVAIIDTDVPTEVPIAEAAE